MDESRRYVVSGTIKAAPEQVFAILADPARHVEIDGAGMLRGTSSAAPVTGVGDAFIIDMRQDGLGDYQMRNEIIAFEPGRRIAWAPAPYNPPPVLAGLIAGMDTSGYHYAWELEPTPGGHTAVTHSYDWSGVKDEKFLAFFPIVSAEQMSQTIARIDEMASEDPA